MAAAVEPLTEVHVMNSIFIEARQLLLDRRVTLLRTAGLQTGATSEVFAREPDGGAAAAGAGISASVRHDVAEIKAALARIDARTYGECERCGHGIGRQRLRAIPEARLCVACRSAGANE
jgi:DnaK suppressor protein